MVILHFIVILKKISSNDNLFDCGTHPHKLKVVTKLVRIPGRVTTTKTSTTDRNKNRPSLNLPPLMRKLNTRPASTWNGYLICHKRVRLASRLTDSPEYYLGSASTKSRRTSCTGKKLTANQPSNRLTTHGVLICVCGFGGRSTPGARAGPLPAPLYMQQRPPENRRGAVRTARVPERHHFANQFHM